MRFSRRFENIQVQPLEPSSTNASFVPLLLTKISVHCEKFKNLQGDTAHPAPASPAF